MKTWQQIEAARTGNSGDGFAVVAKKVEGNYGSCKELELSIVFLIPAV